MRMEGCRQDWKLHSTFRWVCFIRNFGSLQNLNMWNALKWTQRLKELQKERRVHRTFLTKHSLQWSKHWIRAILIKTWKNKLSIVNLWWINYQTFSCKCALGFIMDRRLKVHTIIQHVCNEWYSSMSLHKLKLFSCRHHRINKSVWIMFRFSELWFSVNFASSWFWIFDFEYNHSSQYRSRSFSCSCTCCDFYPPADCDSFDWVIDTLLSRALSYISTN